MHRFNAFWKPGGNFKLKLMCFNLGTVGYSSEQMQLVNVFCRMHFSIVLLIITLFLKPFLKTSGGSKSGSILDHFYNGH